MNRSATSGLSLLALVGVGFLPPPSLPSLPRREPVTRGGVVDGPASPVQAELRDVSRGPDVRAYDVVLSGPPGSVEIDVRVPDGATILVAPPPRLDLDGGPTSVPLRVRLPEAARGPIVVVARRRGDTWSATVETRDPNGIDEIPRLSLPALAAVRGVGRDVEVAVAGR